MSRFDTGRRLRVAVWTAAALAWGTTSAMAAQRAITEDPQQGDEPAGPSSTVVVGTSAQLPTIPSDGLVIIRFQPNPETEPEVRTVYVQSAPQPRATSSAAPQPKSSGS